MTPRGPGDLDHIQQDATRHEHVLLLGATTYRLMSGSAALTPVEPGPSSLTAMPTAGGVDRLRVEVLPVIACATGMERIFDGYPDVALDLVDTRTFDGRLRLVEREPTVLDGPPCASG